MSTHKHLIFGIHAVSALLARQPERVLQLCLLQGRHDKAIEPLIAQAKQLGIAIEQCSRQAVDKMASEANHQGVVAVCKQAASFAENDLEKLIEGAAQPLILILDGVQDPHNLGACFRSADAAGATAIVVPKDNAVGITPVVSKVACGAVETVPFVQVTNLKRCIDKLKDLGVWVFGAAGEAEQSIYQADFKGPCAIVMGAEGKGLRRLTRESCDVLIKIPMIGSVESLNVSVATGVVLFEVLRQRL